MVVLAAKLMETMGNLQSVTTLRGWWISLVQNRPLSSSANEAVEYPRSRHAPRISITAPRRAALLTSSAR